MKKIIFLLFTTIVILGFPYFVNAEVLPKINSIVPAQIQNGGEIEIIGENFGVRQDTSDFSTWVISDYRDNNVQQLLEWSDTKIRIKFNSFRLGTNSLCISNPYRTCFPNITVDVCSTENCAEIAPPKIISFSPSTVRFGDTLEIIGKNFDTLSNKTQMSMSPSFGATAEVISWSNTKIVVKIMGTVPREEYGVSSSYVNEMGSSLSIEPAIITVKDVCKPADVWSCGDYDVCSESGIQTRTCVRTSECQSLDSPMPTLTNTCNYTPTCTANDYSCGNWSACSYTGTQNRTCDKTINCQGGVSSPAIEQSCNYTPTCTSFNYSSWSECTSDGKQTRNITSKYPSNCEGGVLPKTTQSCTYTPTCTADTWTCGSWNECSLSGIQNRSCSKTFDCSSVETAPPTTSQYCEAPNRPQQQIPQDSSGGILNQSTIIKSTVKLLCPVDAKRASQGSGTIIDSSGTILTNKHVVVGTLGCLVGFINNFNNEPYFGERHIADILKMSSNQDIAVLKIRNPQNKNLPSVNITKGSKNFRLGTKISTFGFPAKFGTKITYTSGDFSGTDGSYLKTTAILEYGNSGGGAYIKDGTFIGVPSAVVSGELNALGYILSINTINAWLGNASIVSDSANNKYSRVSILDDIDLKTLDSLKLFIPETDASGNITTPVVPAITQKDTEKSQSNQIQEESTVIEADKSTSTNQEINPEQNDSVSSKKRKDSSIKVLEQRRNMVANAVQEIIKVAERNGGVGQQIKTIAQTQTQNQEKLETGIQKIQSRSGFTKFFIGPNYGEIKSSKKLLGQNKEQIQELNQIRTQVVDQGDQLQILEQIQIIERANQQIETLLNEAQKGFSLFGWMFRLFTK